VSVACVRAANTIMAIFYYVVISAAIISSCLCIEQALAEVELETRADRSPNFSTLLDSPKVIHEIPSSGGFLSVPGIASLGSQLFLLKERLPIVEVFNTANFSRVSEIQVPDLKIGYGMVASEFFNCLYINDAHGFIHMVNLTDRYVKKWSVGSSSSGISITRNHNLLVTLPEHGKLEEYTTDGRLVKSIQLNESIIIPRHAIKLTNGNFVVCHGSGPGIEMIRVVTVDVSGRIINSYGGAHGTGYGRIDGPGDLAVDEFDNVLLADYGKSRLHLLASDMTHLGDVILLDQQLFGPFRLYFDDVSKLLYVVEFFWPCAGCQG